MRRFEQVFKVKKPIIGMIHVAALPGTPRSGNDLEAIVAKAKREAETYLQAGLDALAIENMHDTPYLNKRVGPEITATMTAVGLAVKAVVGDLPVGIQILASANREALAVAQAAGLDFVRAEGFVFGHIGDEGYTESCAGELLRYRKQIGAENILVFTDIKKKHSAHALTADVTIEETAHAAEFFLSDGVIVTGVATGTEADPAEIKAVKKTVRIPVLVGSGVTLENLETYLGIADALIIGSYFKEGGSWEREIDPRKTGSFMEKVRELRGQA